jgi:hypothetical protein
MSDPSYATAARIVLQKTVQNIREKGKFPFVVKPPPACDQLVTSYKLINDHRAYSLPRMSHIRESKQVHFHFTLIKLWEYRATCHPLSPDELRHLSE